MPGKVDKNQKLIDTWQLEDEQAFELEDLINAPPFKQTSDDSGESSTVSTRVPSWLMRRVTKMREIPGSPYEINSDVLRDAIWLGMQILQLRYKLHDWEIEKKLASVIDATGMSHRISVQVNELCKNLEKMKTDDDDERAVMQLTKFILAIQTIRDDWHKRTIIKLLKRRGIVTELLPRCTTEVKEIML